MGLLIGLNTDRPGLGGLGEGWAGMTNSSPKVSHSLSDSEIGRSFVDVWLVVASFAGNRVSSNFTSWEISMWWWAAFQNWYPLDPGGTGLAALSLLRGLSLPVVAYIIK